MADCSEVFVDKMSVLSIGNGGTIAKLVFTSQVPDNTGRMVDSRSLVLTIPVSQLQRMLREIRHAGIEPEQVQTSETTRVSTARN
jgi:hypothetical protein